MNILIEQEINNLQKMGFSENVAGIIASNKYKKPDQVNALLSLEQEYQKLIQEERLKNLVPMVITLINPTFPVRPAQQSSSHKITESDEPEDAGDS